MKTSTYNILSDENKDQAFCQTAVMNRAINDAFKIDCMRFMCWLDQFAYYVGLVDPIYGINGNSHRKNKGRGKLTQSKEYHNALWYQDKTPDEYFIELKRVTKHQIIFGANYFPSIAGSEIKTPRREEYAQFLKDHPTNWIIWDKVNGTTSFNDCELIWVSFPIPSEVFYFMWSGMMQGKSFIHGKIMNPYKKLNQNRIHPTEKPFEIYKYLLSRFVPEGATVLDTHLGSGSQRIVCYDMNINFTGLEIAEQYFNDQQIRFNGHVSQCRMFRNWS